MQHFNCGATIPDKPPTGIKTKWQPVLSIIYSPRRSLLHFYILKHIKHGLITYLLIFVLNSIREPSKHILDTYRKIIRVLYLLIRPTFICILHVSQLLYELSKKYNELIIMEISLLVCH